MAQINKPSDYFNTILTAGGAQSITGVGFQPDLVWNKRRDDTSDHHINDAVRGATKILFTNQTLAEQTSANFISSFDSDGFTTGSGYWNSGASIVAWNWLAGGTGVSNTDGNVTTTVSVNQTSGFSIVKYTVSSDATMSLGHGLNAVPKMIISKSVSTISNWDSYHVSTGNTGRMQLNLTSAFDVQANVWSNTTPTSSVFYQAGNGNWHALGAEVIAYCFADVKGFSKFGSYTGNGSADGTFVYTGFKPAMVIVKRTDTTNNWLIFDNKRDTYNLAGHILFANTNDSEQVSTTSNILDFTSNGFKLRSTYSANNASGGTYIYMAFASEPLVGTNNIPTTAR